MRSSLFLILAVVLPFPLSGQYVPGDSIGFTLHDFVTNGSPYRNLINHEDGILSLARLASTDSVNLGSWFSCSSDHGYQWDPLVLVEQTGAAASTGIDAFNVAGGTEVILSLGRAELLLNTDAARCAGVWTGGPGPTNYFGPRHALGDGFDFHLLLFDPDSLRLVYAHSSDFGSTWDLELLLFSHPGHVPEADAYDLAVRGSVVAAVTAGAGGDVVLTTSTDSGAGWMEEVIYDVAGPALSLGEDEWQPDGACALVLDYEGKPHVVWSNYLAVGDSGGTVLIPSIEAGILYWSDSTGIVEIALPTQDSTMDPPVGRDGNFASQPDIGIDDDNRPFVVFSQLVSERDDSMRNFQRVYAVCSYDGGRTWGEPVDVGYGIGGYDASFPSLADRIDRSNGFLYAHMVFNTDRFAGNSVSGNHPEIPVAIRYLRFGYIDVAVNELTDVPADISLGQNYPNPFNPTTTFEFSLRSSVFANLTVYDLLGREIAVLVNEKLTTGTHTVRWDASGLPGGVYFYRLTTDSFVQTRRLLLLR